MAKTQNNTDCNMVGIRREEERRARCDVGNATFLVKQFRKRVKMWAEQRRNDYQVPVLCQHFRELN